ncbi:hypothetical protein EMCRGX_G011896 [Ephydatia muelleri]
MEHRMTVRGRALSHAYVWLTIAAHLCCFHLSRGMENVFCFDGSECAGNRDTASLSMEDCCLRHPAGSYFSTDVGTCVNCRSIPLFFCKSAGPPGAPLITGVDLTDTRLTLQWNTSSTGGIPIGYNVTIQSSDATLRLSVNRSQSSYMLAVEVAESVLYDITIAALNCAGANQTTHRLFNLSGSIRATMVVDIDNSVHLELVWFNAMQTLSSYEVAVTKSGENRSATQELQCNASKCVCVQQLTAFQSSYEIQVQSYTRQGVLIAKGITRVEHSPEIAISQVQLQRSSPDTVEIGCYFQKPQLHHCLVCCGFNIDALGPSVFNVSTSNYANTTVILKGLHTNLLYDCTAAAVGTAAANCTSPIVGSTKLLFKVGIQVPETATHSTIRTDPTFSSLDTETLPRPLLIVSLFVSLIALF